MTESVVIAIAAIWIAIGLTTAWYMGRRGHSPYPWGVIGTVFGPMVVFLAVDAIYHEKDVTSRPARPARPPAKVSRSNGFGSGGPVDILVGIDGSAQSIRAAEAAIALAGNRLGRLTFATVIDFDLAQSGRPREEELAAEQRLAAAAGRFRASDPDTRILAGRAATTLIKTAAEQGYALLAVGSRGSGFSTRMLGSVARQLAGTSEVPVLIVGEGADHHRAPLARTREASSLV